MHYWLLFSYSLTVLIRLFQFIGHYLSTVDDENEARGNNSYYDQSRASFNWSNDKKLKRISFCVIAVLFPFFIVWTLIGIFWFSVSYQGAQEMKENYNTKECFASFQEYSFVLFWVIITFLWIIYTILLIATYCVTSNRTRVLQKNIITLLRKIDFEDNELLENSRANIQAENAKRNDMIQILNEYGIYFMNYGLTQNEIIRFETKQYVGDLDGNTRCVICINDFKIGERVRVYPGCNHLFHLKCSQLWLEIEGICPICFTTPQLKPINSNEIVFPINNQYIPISEVLSTNFSSLDNASGQDDHNAVPQQLNINNPMINNMREPLLARV